MSRQYGELRPTNGWDLFGSLGHPCKFQRVWRLGSVTGQHSISGCQPNFASLNRGRYLYSAGWPSRWALAHILVSLAVNWNWNWKHESINLYKNPKFTFICHLQNVMCCQCRHDNGEQNLLIYYVNSISGGWYFRGAMLEFDLYLETIRGVKHEG